MKIENLTLKFAFTGEKVFDDFHEFISQNGRHSLNDFEHDAIFAFIDPNYNQILINDCMYWMSFENENKPFRLKDFKDEYMLEFKSEENTHFYKIKNIIEQYWVLSKHVYCNIEVFSVLQSEKIQEEPSFDPFWRPKRIEISNYRY